MHDSNARSSGALAMLAGGMVTLFAAGTSLGAALGEPISTLRVTLAAAALVVGPIGVGWGRRTWRRGQAEHAAVEASIPTGERVDDIDQVAETFGTLQTPADPGPRRVLDTLLEDEREEHRPERHDHVRFARHGVALVAYRSSFSGRRRTEDAGPGTFEEAHWRVRTELDTPLVFHVLGRNVVDELLARAGLPSAGLGDETFDTMFESRTEHMEWLRTHLTPELRQVLVRNPPFVLRSHRGRVEVIWPVAAGPHTRARFEDASELVTAMARALSGLAVVPYR